MYSFTQHMTEIGYQPTNNIHGLQGIIMCPTGPGLPWVPPMHEVQVTTDRIRIFTLQFFGEPYTKASWWDTITVAVFGTVDDFLIWCTREGRLSEPGLPAFSNAWD